MSRHSYYERNINSPQEKATQEAFDLGRDYMEGKKSIADVERYLNRGNYHPHLTRTEVNKKIMLGVKYAEDEGKAKASRVQPIQDEIGPLKKTRTRKTSQGRLATRPEHTRYKAPTKAQKRERAGTRAYAARPKALNAFDVKAQRKRDLKILLNKHARGQIGVKEVKRESRAAAQGKAYKNVVYNETRHKYVGKNRVR